MRAEKIEKEFVPQISHRLRPILKRKRVLIPKASLGVHFRISGFSDIRVSDTEIYYLNPNPKLWISENPDIRNSGFGYRIIRKFRNSKILDKNKSDISDIRISEIFRKHYLNPNPKIRISEFSDIFGSEVFGIWRPWNGKVRKKARKREKCTKSTQETLGVREIPNLAPPDSTELKIRCLASPNQQSGDRQIAPGSFPLNISLLLQLKTCSIHERSTGYEEEREWGYERCRYAAGVDLRSSVVVLSISWQYLPECSATENNQRSARAASHSLAPRVVDMQNSKVPDRFSDASISDLVRVMVETRKHVTFPFVYRLLKLAMVLVVETTSAEKCFSAMKLVKINLCNRIADHFLNNCVICAIEREAQVTNEDMIVLTFKK
ncbi:hypothetical protein OSB04_012375 [Centaurea solstitialis]|uniref:HAT C-terminal dimerisation domain-containing protein n=1 Tax=Centaurea solstitialis TaxID=347529 RepID=A0AA38TPA3_9ASTR|nr:hypothetical protein OSB04_012375 [Centaurea solstitialis]